MPNVISWWNVRLNNVKVTQKVKIMLKKCKV